MRIHNALCAQSQNVSLKIVQLRMTFLGQSAPPVLSKSSLQLTRDLPYQPRKLQKRTGRQLPRLILVAGLQRTQNWQKNGLGQTTGTKTNQKGGIMNRIDYTLKLLKKKPRTRFELTQLVGQMNSPELIRKLRKRGYLIRTELIDVKDRWGKVCRTAKYFLCGGDK